MKKEEIVILPRYEYKELLFNQLRYIELVDILKDNVVEIKGKLYIKNKEVNFLKYIIIGFKNKELFFEDII